MTLWNPFDDGDEPNGEEQLDPGELSENVPFDDIGARIGEGKDPVENQIL